MTTTMRMYIKRIDGEPMLDAQCMALLFGVETTAVHALPIADGAMRIPPEWVKRGKRRAREAMAHTGGRGVIDVLRYWAQRDHNAELKVVEQ